jgi:polysaccharide export outer membrane protein
MDAGIAPMQRRASLAIPFLAALFVAGCSYSPMNKLTLFPQGHSLLPAAKEMRRGATEPADLPRELDKQVLATYTAEPGDVLLVLPADLDSPIRLPGDQTVLLDGSINLGRYGRLLVAGKTLESIEAEIRTTIQAQSSNKDPGPISVRVLTQQSKVYYVIGEVNVPGSFPLKGRETVLDGILSAGGLTDRASRRQIILSRPTLPEGCRVVLPICYQEIIQLGDTTTNYQLAPGDRIYVASRSFGEQFVSRKQSSGPCNCAQTPCGVGCGAGRAACPLPTRYDLQMLRCPAAEPMPGELILDKRSNQ